MITNYFSKIKEYLYDKEILPIIKNGSKLSIEEIVEAMKPVPYETLQDKLPVEFARTMRLMSENKNTKI